MQPPPGLQPPPGKTVLASNPWLVLESRCWEMTAAGVPRLLLLLLVPVAWGGLKAKCPQSAIREQKELLNYYRPGDYLLGGAVSTTRVFFQPRPLTEHPSISFSW